MQRLLAKKQREINDFRENEGAHRAAVLLCCGAAVLTVGFERGGPAAGQREHFKPIPSQLGPELSLTTRTSPRSFPAFR